MDFKMLEKVLVTMNEKYKVLIFTNSLVNQKGLQQSGIIYYNVTKYREKVKLNDNDSIYSNTLAGLSMFYWVMYLWS